MGHFCCVQVLWELVLKRYPFWNINFKFGAKNNNGKSQERVKKLKSALGLKILTAAIKVTFLYNYAMGGSDGLSMK